jgi:hypothetical protein
LSIGAAVPPNTEISRSFGAPQDLEFFLKAQPLLQVPHFRR